MIWLLHPSHRKFVKLLHQKVGVGGRIVITKDDWTSFINLWPKYDNNSLLIHKGVYELFLKAASRQYKDIDMELIHTIIRVSTIESELRRIELKNLLRVVVNVLIYYLERSSRIRRLRKARTSTKATM